MKQQLYPMTLQICRLAKQGQSNAEPGDPVRSITSSTRHG
jgi:hypothetical protein